MNLVEPGAMIAFSTRSGTLTAERDGEWILLDFPATPAEPAVAPPELVAVLGVRPRWTGRSRFDWLVEVGGPTTCWPWRRTWLASRQPAGAAPSSPRAAVPAART